MACTWLRVASKVWLVSGLLWVCQCATTNLARSLWDDEAAGHRYRGGWFSYPSSGLASVAPGWQQEIHRQAKLWCGEREVVWRSSQESAVPYGSPSTSLGSEGAAGWMSQQDQALYLRSPFGPAFGQLQQRRSMVFQCAELNGLEHMYHLIWQAGRLQPTCQAIDVLQAPNQQRLQIIRTLPETTDCLQQQGWLLVQTPQDNKLWFLGEEGYQSCQAMAEAFQQQPRVQALQAKPLLPQLQCPWHPSQSSAQPSH